MMNPNARGGTFTDNMVMRLTLTISRVAVCLCVLASCGCSLTPQHMVEHDARMIVEPAAMPGKMALRVIGGGNDKMKSRGHITQYGRVTASDGVDISYWVIQHYTPEGAPPRLDKARGTVVLVHPLLASKLWFLYLGEELASRGYDVVLPDLRGHGESGGQYTTWGYKEKDDIKRVMDRVMADRVVAGPVYVMGASLGGLVAVQYAAYDKRCSGVVAICPPSGAREVAKRILPLAPEHDLNQRITLAGKLAGFDPSDASALKAARQLDCPIILVHGYMDMVVPSDHSQAIYHAAHQPKNLVVVPWADHMNIQIGQDDFLADQLDAVTTMGRG